MTGSARRITLYALMRVEEDDAYSNITLNHCLSGSGLSKTDKRFVSRMFYGVLENRLLLDYNIAVCSDRPLQKLDPKVLIILRMGLYQLFLMDGVPASAAVNESVGLCKQIGKASASGFVNGLLRSASKQSTLKLPDPKKGRNKYYSVKYSCPENIVRLWRESYGDENAVGIMEALAGRPPICLRVNTLKTDTTSLRAMLIGDGIEAEVSPVLDDCLRVGGTGSIEAVPAYKKGLFHVQDEASQICCSLLAPEENRFILDVCSAPGGKSFTCAELMNDKGSITACDLYPARLKLVEDGARRLGISIIRTEQADAAKKLPDIKAESVLCDVPCSGLGILRRKPELRYKESLGLQELPEIQYRILCRASMCVKSGGRLVYSTCTLNPSENHGNVQRFLSEHEDFVPEPISLPKGVRRGIEENENELTLFPHLCGTDGFFISLFRRK